MSNSKKRRIKILVLTSSTGGGHDMRANALRAWAHSAHARDLAIDVVVHQTLETTSRFYNFGVWLYNFIQRVWPRVHHVYFRFLEWAALLKSSRLIKGGKGFREFVREIRPDIILSTHPHLNHGFMKLCKSAGLERPPRCVTYCGELHFTYGFSRHWVNPEIDLFIGAVQDTCRAAVNLGMNPAKIWTGGFMLKPVFYRERMSRESQRQFLRDQLRLDPDQFTLVLATGANGANNHTRLLRALNRKAIRPQVVALCGRSPQIQMEVLHWAAEHPEFTVRALGYYQDMHVLLQCADAVVARPGTGTTSEAILCGCPVIFNTLGGAMPQEMITMRYFREHNWPKPVGRARSLPNRVAHFMSNPEHHARARKSMRALNPQGEPMEILKKLRSLVEEADAETERTSG